MIRRLSIVAGLTGSSHLVSIGSVALVSHCVLPETIGKVGVMETSFLFLVAIISFGLQVSATRYIAISSDWLDRFRLAQTAKLTMGIVISLLALAVYGYTGDARYLLYLGAPVVALNGDYALYGRGMAEYASLVSFLRNLFPALVLAVLGRWYPEYLLPGYGISLVVSYLYAGFLSTRGLRARYLYRPRLSSLKEYLTSLNIGIFVVAHFAMTFGVIFVAQHFYEEKELGLFYIALKLYIIYQGVKRLIVQAFFKDMVDAGVALKVDQLSILAAAPIVITTVLFSRSFVLTIFDEVFIGASIHFILLGCTIFVQSVGTSATTSILLSKDDNRLTVNLVVSATLTLALCILFSFLFESRGFGISLSMLIGEIAVFALNALAVRSDTYLVDRLRFLVMPALLLLIPVAVSCFLGDTLVNLIVSLAIFSAVAAVRYFRHFQD